MAGIARKLLQKLPDQRLVTCLNQQNLFDLLSPSISQQNRVENRCLLQNLCSNISTKEEFVQNHASQIYPSFSFGYFLNHPLASSGLYRSQSLSQYQSLGVKDLDLEYDSRIMWADSVKKKRKRKMNKHKLRKLRKRLRGHS